MKKQPFKGKFPQKPVDNFKHIPNKIVPDIERFEKEKSELGICTPSVCPFTFFVFTNGQSIECTKCGKTVRGLHPTC